MSLRRIGIACLLLVFLMSGSLVLRVRAAESRQGDQCLIAEDEVIESDIYIACNTLTIEGTVQGDVIGGAWDMIIAPTGHVEGDIWLIGGHLRIDGQVDDDVRFGGVDLDLTPAAELQASSDLSAIALNIEVWDGAVVPGEMLILGYQAIVSGRVEGNIHFNGSALVIDGRVDGDVDAIVGGGDTSPSFIPFPFPFSVSFQTPGLTVRSEGRIGGDLRYSGSRPGNINGRIGGEIDFSLNQPRPDITQAALEPEVTRPTDFILRYLNTVLTDVLSLMAAGILVMVIAPAWIREPARIVPRQTPSSFGWGLILALMTAPVSLILLLVSVLFLVFVSMVTLGGFTWMGLVLLLIVNFVVIGGMFFVALFLTRLVISELLGRWLGRRFIQSNGRLPLNLLSLLLGAVVYSLLTNVPLPYVGLVINAIGIFIGLGAIALHARQLYQRTVRVVYPSRATQTEISAIPAPALDVLLGHTPEPPPDSNEPAGPGMENLPDGFSWWDDKS